MLLETFRKLVDASTSRIGACEGDPVRLYAYLGMEFETSYQRTLVSTALYERIRNSFRTGRWQAWNICRNLQKDLIREHVIRGVPLAPYFEVLNHLRDALQGSQFDNSDVVGDWSLAILAALDHVEFSDWKTLEPRRLFLREFSVAEAATALQGMGYRIALSPNSIALEPDAEIALVAEIEKLVSRLGGLNVARKIFSLILPQYDRSLGRYLIVPRTGLGDIQKHPDPPWGYLLQLAVKHIDGQKPYFDMAIQWPRLLSLATAYAAVLDVQLYTPPAFMNFDAKTLLTHVQDQALYDSVFRFLQLRPSDVAKLCRGAFGFLDAGARTPGGWTLKEAIDVIEYLVDPRHGETGPFFVSEAAIARALPHIKKDVIRHLIQVVLSHSSEGSNRHFSRPTDALAGDEVAKGADFYLRPLIRRPGNRYLVVDRAACGWGFVEALLAAFRPHETELGNKIGGAIERFVEEELTAHGVPTFKGDYNVGGKHGECDLVAVTDRTLMFIELKAKALTRLAMAGSDADLLLDLAEGMVKALAQAGWHELRISRANSLTLKTSGRSDVVELGDREIEKIAVALMDFGSFQDRILLKQFLEAVLNANFASDHLKYADRFKKINKTLQEIQQQYVEALGEQVEVRQPFFNCWFVSIPQLLVLLDEVTDAETFRNALWGCRAMTTGTSDLYFEIANVRKRRAANG